MYMYLDQQLELKVMYPPKISAFAPNVMTRQQLRGEIGDWDTGERSTNGSRARAVANRKLAPTSLINN